MTDETKNTLRNATAFRHYLETTMIPSLREAGYIGTANDVQASSDFIASLCHTVAVEDERHRRYIGTAQALYQPLNDERSADMSDPIHIHYDALFYHLHQMPKPTIADGAYMQYVGDLVRHPVTTGGASGGTFLEFRGERGGDFVLTFGINDDKELCYNLTDPNGETIKGEVLEHGTPYVHTRAILRTLEKYPYFMPSWITENKTAILEAIQRIEILNA